MNRHDEKRAHELIRRIRHLQNLRRSRFVRFFRKSQSLRWIDEEQDLRKKLHRLLNL